MTRHAGTCLVPSIINLALCLRLFTTESSISFVLMGMYEAMGDTLSLQYGGSEAHSAFFQRRKGESEAAMQGKDLVTSVRCAPSGSGQAGCAV